MRISDWSSDVCSSDLAARSYPGKCSRLVGAAASDMVVRAYARLGDTRRSHCDRDGGRPGNFCRLCCKRPVSRLAWSGAHRSEEHTSELQSLMRISYAVFCLKKKKKHQKQKQIEHTKNIQSNKHINKLNSTN